MGFWITENLKTQAFRRTLNGSRVLLWPRPGCQLPTLCLWVVQQEFLLCDSLKFPSHKSVFWFTMEKGGKNQANKRYRWSTWVCLTVPGFVYPGERIVRYRVWRRSRVGPGGWLPNADLVPKPTPEVLFPKIAGTIKLCNLIHIHTSKKQNSVQSGFKCQGKMLAYSFFSHVP